MAAISFLAQGIGKLALFDDYVRRKSNALLAMARREGSGSMRICLNDVKEQDSWTPFQPPGIGSLLDLRQTRHVRRTKNPPCKILQGGGFHHRKGVRLSKLYAYGLA